MNTKFDVMHAASCEVTNYTTLVLPKKGQINPKQKMYDF